jgi:ribosomal protein L44E
VFEGQNEALRNERRKMNAELDEGCEGKRRMRREKRGGGGYIRKKRRRSEKCVKVKTDQRHKCSKCMK